MNLKIDLVNKLSNAKYFCELELARLAQDPNMNYKDKINDMSRILGDVAILNAQLGGVEQYFPSQPQQAPVPAPLQQGQVHQGQTHGE